jgi:hypothetical protein
VKPLYKKTLLRFLPIVFNLERANQLSLLPDKDLADFCPLIEPYQVTKNPLFLEILTPSSPNSLELLRILKLY